MEYLAQDPLLSAVVYPTPEQKLFFLEGPAGAGKTSLAVRRLLHLLESGTPAESILVWVPQPILGRPYTDALKTHNISGGEVTVTTVGGLARRTITLLWPVIAEKAGFAHPDHDPVFINHEAAQYYVDRVASPYIEAGYFDGLYIQRNRILTQILNNLGKTAAAGFPHTQAAERLKSAWGGEKSRNRTYDYAQICANEFRAYCLAHNLIDFSLQYEVFFEHCLSEPLGQAQLFGRYRHLIVDNIEEDTFRAHDLLKQWLPECETALLVMDQDAGYRTFLSADPQSAAGFRELCDAFLVLEQSYVMSPDVAALSEKLVACLGSEACESISPGVPDSACTPGADPKAALRYELQRFQPQMLEWVADQVALLIREEGIPPNEIVVLAPYLGDALRFAVSEALSRRNIPVRSHRPSRALSDEPATHCLLTLAALAHPSWQRCPPHADVAQALMVAIDGLDLIRARLLADAVYRTSEGHPVLNSFDQIVVETQQRISFTLGVRFEQLRRWLVEYAASEALELGDWINLLFNDVLSRPGFGFHQNLDAGRVTANLIDSVRVFRHAVGDILVRPESEGKESPNPLSLEYIRMVEQGVIAALYLENWELDRSGAVLVAPAYTFLVANRPADVQFWLDISSERWWERLYQPLTHPYVLSRHWPEGKVWGDEDEFAVRQLELGRLIRGLIRRCRKRIYLGIAELGEQGYEQRGPLLQAVQRLLRETSPLPA